MRRNNSGRTGQCELRKRRSASATNYQVGTKDQRRHLIDEREHHRIDAHIVVSTLSILKLTVARLVHDLPTRELLAKPAQCTRHVFVERRIAARATEDDEPL